MFEIREDFYFNGEPLKIISGAIHYFRVVPEYWEDRLLKLKAMGCNTVETYVPWNMHEPTEGDFNFQNRFNIKRFIQLAEKLNLFVIVRPSPYICAEWEFGGLPSWLIKDRNMKLRTAYPPFLNKVEAYLKRLLAEITPLQCTNGGPIIMMQVENEYGSYGNDKEYLHSLTDLMIKYGVDVPLVTSDGTWGDMLENGTIPDRVFPTVNFGSDASTHFEKLSQFIERKIPLMVMEYWNGWFSAWGNETFNHLNSEIPKEELESILSLGHVNFYMFHGGTHFGFTSGSNVYDGILSPDITSYDYGAPVTEWGDITEKYKIFQKVIHNHLNKELPMLPENPVRKAYGKVSISEKTSLFEQLDLLSSAVSSPYPLTMEDLDQDFGYILYRGNLGDKRGVDMKLLGTNDRAQVFVNQEAKFTQYDKELGNTEKITLTEEKNKIDILVENLGRVNYGERMVHQHKGINDGLYVNGAFRSDWNHYCLPLDNPEQIDFSRSYKEKVPAFYRTHFEIEEVADTFIDMSGWGKGVVFINGFNIGRFWDIGPQYKLYIPAPLLKQGMNEVIIFETEGKVKEVIDFTDQPPY